MDKPGDDVPTSSSHPAGEAPQTSTPGPAAGRGDRVGEVMQTVLTGLVLAFIMRAFLVEPFIIPTGSMSQALLGGHATETCPGCGYEFDYAPLRGADTAQGVFVRPEDVVCPNCHLHITPGAETTIPKAGDRVLVHKWPYALGLTTPQRWDVVVFRDPSDAEQHYIKRVVALPNETIEIVDGDVYIDERIARKPPYAQRVLWFPIFDQSFVPHPASPSARHPRWVALDAPPGDAPGWGGLDERVLRYRAADAQPRAIAFNADAARGYMQDFYAYNHGSAGHFVGDIRLRATLHWYRGDGWVRLELQRAPRGFAVQIHRDGRAELTTWAHDAPNVVQTLVAGQVARGALDRPWALEFAHVDYRVYLKLNGMIVVTTDDQSYAPDLAALRRFRRSRPTGTHLVAANCNCAWHDLRIERDVYYTDSPDTRRAHAGAPFVLRDKEYFVLGDNSPDSHDSREWTTIGPHLPPKARPGTVRADQIVGQAALVYLPGLLPGDERGRWFLPDLGRVRFVR